MKVKVAFRLLCCTLQNSYLKMGSVVKPTITCDDKMPLVVVIGATGTGKSKLAIDLCRKYGGEVVNMDAIQLYEGLDISTNKVSSEEMEGVQHHLIGVLSPTVLGFTIVDFRALALEAISEISSRGKLPVLVGGTGYYLESILWDSLLSDWGKEDSRSGLEVFSRDLPLGWEHWGTEALYEKLKEMDPKAAEEVHPGNRRRIVRAIQIFQQLGRSRQDLLEEQQQRDLELRFPRIAVLWLTADKSILQQRLYQRVDVMVAAGMRREVSQFYDQHFLDYKERMDRYSVAGTNDVLAGKYKGIFQSIAIKEFLDFLHLDPSSRDTPDGDKLFLDGLEKLKIGTRKYARKQEQWIRNRFLRRPGVELPPVYCLDTGDPSTWDAVSATASEVVGCLLSGAETQSAPLLPPSEKQEEARNRAFFCEVCRRHIFGLVQWTAHQSGREHRHLQSRLRRERLELLSQLQQRLSDLHA